MKLILTVFACAVLPLAALTSEDLTPTALAGKTLTFTIESGTAPLANIGKWSGTFETTPKDGFTVRNITGNTVNIGTTAVYDGVFSGLYDYYIDPILSSGDRRAAILTIWVSSGSGRYSLTLRANNPFTDPEINQIGGFTIGAGVTTRPEIAVQQPLGSNLTDGTAKKSFGTVVVGDTGTSKTFLIRNTGNAPLTGLAVQKSGLNKADFIVGPLDKVRLLNGEVAKFKVIFKPRAAGIRNASIAIASNDTDENPFDIKLTGQGTN